MTKRVTHRNRNDPSWKCLALFWFTAISIWKPSWLFMWRSLAKEESVNRNINQSVRYIGTNFSPSSCYFNVFNHVNQHFILLPFDLLTSWCDSLHCRSLFVTRVHADVLEYGSFPVNYFWFDGGGESRFLILSVWCIITVPFAFLQMEITLTEFYQ